MASYVKHASSVVLVFSNAELQQLKLMLEYAVERMPKAKGSDIGPRDRAERTVFVASDRASRTGAEIT